MMGFFQSLVSQNIDGVAAFIDRLLQHDGEINFQHLYKVVEEGDSVALTVCDVNEKINNYAVLIGGEVSNSFSPLYEISSIFRGLFLAGVGTAFLDRFCPYAERQYDFSSAEIVQKLLQLSEVDLKNGIEAPVISIICDLDTDIEPYRYVKHQLWGLNEESMKKRCADISQVDLLSSEIDTSLKDIYWISQDQSIAEQAIQSSKSLPEAKAIQFYLTGQILLAELGIEISKSRLYFQFVPKEELMFLGANSDVLQVISALHNPKSMKILSKLLESKTPWTFSFSCPNCGESSKRVINPEFNKTLDIIHLKCSQSKREFRNELGTVLLRQGCGHKWDVPIPSDPNLLFQLLEKSSFTVSCAIRELIRVIKSSSISPICYVANSIGLKKSGDRFEIIPNLPKGFGDHRKLMTSVFSLQHLLINGDLEPEITHRLKSKGLLKSKEMQLMIRASQDLVHDNELKCADNNNLYVTDTSALKALQAGYSVWELFERAIDIHEITLPELIDLKNKS
ncbi:hypothetical protein PseudUWO310_08230 [Pseudanabaena sp. UWO310]|nr:hypothetical protein PseudUWO310_08230 [Pseudanabaena sp. UWO310]